MKKFIAALTALVLFAGVALAADNDQKTDKTTQKARQAVEKASPEDWFTLAESAEMCFKKGVNLKEAATWIDQSLAIKETAFNLEVKGDYYLASNLPDKAMEYYIKSIQKAQEEPEFDAGRVQQKIVKLKNG